MRSPYIYINSINFKLVPDHTRHFVRYVIRKWTVMRNQTHQTKRLCNHELNNIQKPFSTKPEGVNTTREK